MVDLIMFTVLFFLRDLFSMITASQRKPQLKVSMVNRILAFVSYS